MGDELGRRLRQRRHAPNNVNELTQALQMEWNNIARRVHRNMRRRMLAVIQKMVGRRVIDCADVDA